FVSVSNRISRAVLAVPGGSWSNLLARSFVYTSIKAVLDPMYPDPLLQQEFVDLLQSRFDPTDPANLGTLLLRHPLPDAPAGRVVALQEAIGDCQVPNLTTEILARTLGVHQLTPALHPIWGVDAVTGPTTNSVVAQFALTQDLMNYTPPDTDVLPTMDNGVH